MNISRTTPLSVIRLGLLALIAASLPAAELTVSLSGGKGNEPLAEAVVSLNPLDQAAPPAPPGTQVEIAQENQEFSAFVTVVQAGTTVLFPNRDSVQHHVYSLSKPRKFELPLYNPGQKESLVFELPGLVTIGCNIHDWMISHLVVVPTPWFAKSDARGTARLAAPAGRYRLEVWHPRMSKPESREITLADGAPTEAGFQLTLKPDRRVRRTLGGKTGGYR